VPAALSSLTSVAKSAQGKLVSRVGASGGGKAYKQRRPVNFYGVVALIVVLGLATVLYSRYEYQNPTNATATTTTLATGPLLNTTSFVGLATEACGTVLGDLPVTATTATAGYHVLANNVVRLQPKTYAEAGVNATVAKLVTEIPGLTLTSTKFVLPTASGQPDATKTYVTGDKCPLGTKYHGQVGRVVVAYWSGGTTAPVRLSTNPSSLVLNKNVLVTLAFEPASVTPQAPGTATIAALLRAEASATTTTTTAPVTTTTAPVTTTTAK
jgi:hypothetical protein